MDQTLCRLERVLKAGLAAELGDVGGGGGVDKEEAAIMFVSELFNFVVQGLNGGRDECGKVTLDNMNQKYSAMGRTIRDVGQASAVKSSAMSRFYPIFTRIKLGWAGDPDSFDAMIQARLKEKIDTEYSKMNRLVAERMMDAGVCRSNTYKEIINYMAKNNATFRGFLQKDVLWTIMRAYLKPKITLIVEDSLYWYERVVESSVSDKGEKIAEELEHNKPDFLTLISSLKRMAKCSDNRAIDLFFDISNVNVDEQQPLIKSIMRRWIQDELWAALLIFFGNDTTARQFITSFKQECISIQTFASQIGIDAIQVIYETREEFGPWYTSQKREFVESGGKVDVFERAFERYVSHGDGWDLFFERLIETGPMSIT